MTTRRTCPADSELIALLTNAPAPAPRHTDKLLRHLAACSRCSRRFAVLREVKRDLQPHVDSYVVSVPSAAGSAALREAALRGLASLSPAPASLHPALRLRRWAFAALFFLIIATAGVYFALSSIQARSELRSPAPTLTLVSPVGSLRDVPSFLRWKPFHNAESYMLEIVDDGLERLFSSSTYLITELRLPAEVRSRLVPGRTYVWSVMAKDIDGNIMTTRSASFAIR
jgi:hypothetical protein